MTDLATTKPADTEADVAAIDELRVLFQTIRKELSKVIIGQDEVIEKLLICIFARGHALLMVCRDWRKRC